MSPQALSTKMTDNELIHLPDAWQNTPTIIHQTQLSLEVQIFISTFAQWSKDFMNNQQQILLQINQFDSHLEQMKDQLISY